MKAFRLRAAVAAIVLILVGAVVVLSNSSFQTWAARRALDGYPSLNASVGRVSVGLSQVELRDVRVEREGAILSAPRIDVDGAVFAAIFRGQLKLERLSAQGWTVDLTRTGKITGAASGASKGVGAAAVAPGSASAGGAVQVPTPAGSSTGSMANPAEVFAGIFAKLQLPFDLALERVELDGRVVLPELRGQVQVAVRGGGLVTGREGKLDFSAKGDLTTTDVRTVAVEGAARVEMNSPRTFAHLAVQADTSATGALFPQGVKLTAHLAASRSPASEKYEASVVAKERNVLRVEGELPKGAARLGGTWKLDVQSADVAPFLFGKSLPDFTAVGEGGFESDVRTSDLRLIGRLTGDVARLGVLVSQLSSVTPLKVATDFDVAFRNPALVVEKLSVDLSDTLPVARIAVQQPFEFNPEAREVRALAPEQDLLAIALHRLPVGWLQPLVPSLAVQGGALRGEFTLSPRGGGVALRSQTPLTVDALSVGREGKPIVKQLDVSLRASADYTPQGWQAELSEFTAKKETTTVLMLDAKAGQLAGIDQAIKLAGKFTAELPALLAQPFLASELPLSKGEASVDFAASLAAKQELQAKVTLKNLAADPALKAAALPTLVADLRLDRDAAGAFALNAPISLEQGERKTELTLAGSITPVKKLHAIDARLTSGDLFVEHLQAIAALWTNPAKAAPAGDASKPTTPPWAGFNGAVALDLKHVVYPGGFEASNVTGTLRLENGAARLETVRAGVGEGSEFKLSGAVTFDANAAQPYALTAELAVNDFDPTPMFRSRAPQQAPTIEGRLSVATTVAGQAATLGGLSEIALGDVAIVSRGGVFRGLPINVSNLTETTSRLASWIASAGSAIGLSGKREQDEITNKTQAATEVSKALGAIAYDQLRLVFTRDVTRQFAVKELTLIAPELRLTGSGRATLNDATPWLERPLAMEYQLRARGRQADLLKFLGVLEANPDDLGYALCTLPLKINGTPVKPDASEASQKIVTVALEKGGLSERASELLNKLRGYGK